MASDTQSNNSHLALVTGATGAIGQAIARQLASHNFQVVLLARNQQKAEQTRQMIVRTTGNHNVRYELADLSRRASITAFAKGWQGPLDVLINNAAVTPGRRQLNPEGIEMQFATNVLGYFWLTQAMTPFLKQAAPARVVNVASYWAGGLDIEDLEFTRRRYDNHSAYRQSKQANRMLTVAFAERLSPLGITVNACHPGDVNSTLSNNLGFGGSTSPDDGARTPVWLATQPAGATQTGKYFEHQRPVHCRFSADKAAIEALYQACLAYSDATSPT